MSFPNACIGNPFPHTTYQESFLSSMSFRLQGEIYLFDFAYYPPLEKGGARGI